MNPNFWGDLLTLLVSTALGLSTAAGLIWLVFFLPEKSKTFREMEFRHHARFVDMVHQNGNHVPAPGTKGMYHHAKKKMIEYMVREGVNECEIAGFGGGIVRVRADKLQEQVLPAEVRVTKILAAMDYDDTQIQRIYNKAANTHGGGIMKNYDELLWFALKEVENV